MQRLSEAIQPQPASLSNYQRMKEPCVRPQLQVQADKQLGRVAFFAQVQVRHTVPCHCIWCTQYGTAFGAVNMGLARL